MSRLTELDVAELVARGSVRLAHAPSKSEPPNVKRRQKPFTASETLAHAMSEKALQESVRQMALLHGWLCYHTFDSRKSSPGFPDLCLVKRFGLLSLAIFAEIKTEKGSLRPEQEDWINALSGIPGAISVVWRPSHWDEIVQVLSGLPDIIMQCKRPA